MKDLRVLVLERVTEFYDITEEDWRRKIAFDVCLFLGINLHAEYMLDAQCNILV